MARILTNPRTNFDVFMDDIDVLLKTHEEDTRGPVSRPAREHDIFKRAALILLITAWESFVEDTLDELFRARLERATTAFEMESTFQAVAHSSSNQGRIDAGNVIQWAGNGWKTKITARFKEELASLNTPNSTNIRHIFRRYLNDDVTTGWSWQGMNSQQACQRLDRLIRLRGELVHRSKEWFDRRDSLPKKTLSEGVSLVQRLVQVTEERYGREPKAH